MVVMADASLGLCKDLIQEFHVTDTREPHIVTSCVTIKREQWILT